MVDIKVIDNFLPLGDADKIEEFIKFIPFRFAKNEWENPVELKVKDSNLTNWNRPGLLQCWTFENNEWNMCDGLQWTEDILQHLPFKYELQRVKVNFNPKINISEDECMHPHCDMNEGKDSYTAIYYVNDSDGDTVIFNETKMDTFLNGEELSIKKRIKSKKGRFVMFKQDYLHAGFPPTKSDYRVVINFNFKML